MDKKQKKYEELYLKIQKEMVESGYANSLFDLCSVSLDRNSNDNQINLEFLINEVSTLEAKTELKKSFDRHSIEYGFKMNYVNLIGDLY